MIIICTILCYAAIKAFKNDFTHQQVESPFYSFYKNISSNIPIRKVILKL